MHKSATKCNETIGKRCKNKHGASNIIDTLETYQSAMEEGWAGRPIGSKKAKRLVESSSTSGIDASITLMVASLSMNSKDTHEIFDARWKAMMETQEEKLKLGKEKVKVAKLEAQSTMFKALNESSNIALEKMKEKAKILTADLSTMDPLARACHMMYRDRIDTSILHHYFIS
jgi:hypothetical protein